MLPILQIGPLAIPTPGLLILAGLWAGLTIAERNAPRFNVNAETLYNLVFAMLVSAILGARLSYVAQFPSAFLETPASLISLNLALLDPWGGAAAALIAGLIYGQRKGMRLAQTLDALTPLLAILGVVLPLANLASGNAFGSATDLPWTIELWGASRHPTQLYETAAGGLILWAVRSKIPAKYNSGYKNGWIFLQFTALSAAARLFLEGFRGDSHIIFNGLRAAQAAAWITLAVTLWGFYRLRIEKRS
jgi:prolipoprotein diacylglyceryltransferase